MQEFEIKEFGGLINNQPEYQMKPSQAVTAKYIDPFRADYGKLRQCFGFKQKAPSNWTAIMNPSDEEQHYVLAAFMMGGVECIIKGKLNAGTFEEVRGYYINSSNALVLMCYYMADNPELQPNYYTDIGIIPTRVLVDPNKAVTGLPTANNYSETYNVYIWGYNIDTTLHTEPKRLTMVKYYATPGATPEVTFEQAPLAGGDIDDLPAITVTAYDSGEPTAGFDTATYYYLFILEDAFGNQYYQTTFYDDYTDATNDHQPRINMSSQNAIKYGIDKIHIYRLNYTDNPIDASIGAIGSDAWIAELFTMVQWRETVDKWSGTAGYWTDTDPSDDVLGDNLPVSQSEMIAQQTNANKAIDAAGFHNGALWIAAGAEVMFSQYDLTAAFGVRPLMFPSGNTWKFEDIGDIVDLQSLDNYLIVFGTRGIKILGGDYINNYYERYIGQISLVKADVSKLEWIKQTIKIGNAIYFLDSNGVPHVLRDLTHATISGLIVERVADVSTGHASTWRPLDMIQYRDGWLISNGETCYLYDTKADNWFEWAEGVRLFTAGQDAFAETVTATDTTAPEYEYFKYYPSTRIYNVCHPPKIYATDGTAPTLTWRSPLIFFPQTQLFKMIFIDWQYDLNYGYGKKQIGSVAKTATAQTLTINFYVDGKAAAVKTVSFAPAEIAEGQYQGAAILGIRGRRLSFEIVSSTMPFTQINGLKIRYEDRGLKSYE